MFLTLHDYEKLSNEKTFNNLGSQLHAIHGLQLVCTLLTLEKKKNEGIIILIYYFVVYHVKLFSNKVEKFKVN